MTVKASAACCQRQFHVKWKSALNIDFSCRGSSGVCVYFRHEWFDLAGKETKPLCCICIGSDDDMFTPNISADEQRELAKKLTTFLSTYSHISDSYVIEFFTENLWHTLPNSWRHVLQDLSYPQIADLLLDASHADRRYPSVWPLSLLAFRTTAHSLAFPREDGQERGRVSGDVKPEEFQDNRSQSSLLGHVFRKHVKPKKQHEIRKLGMLVKQLCDQTGCSRVVDVGSGQGHLSRLLCFGFGLSVTAIEADRTLVAMASRFDGQLMWALEKESQKKNCSSQLSQVQLFPRHVISWVNPKASWETFITQLSAGDCVSEDPSTPSRPSKKRLRGCKTQKQSHVVQVGPSAASTDSRDFELMPQFQSAKKDSGQQLCSDNCCSNAQPVCQDGTCTVDLSQKGHPDFILTGLHACGDLSTTLLRHFVHCPHVRGITSVACCYMKISTKENPTPPGLVEPPAAPMSGHESLSSEFGYPMSSWVRGLPGHQLSYKMREGACHAVEDYIRRLREESELLRTHCYRAILETFIRDVRPELRRAGIQTIKKAHLLSFTESGKVWEHALVLSITTYTTQRNCVGPCVATMQADNRSFPIPQKYARLGLARVGLPADLLLDLELVDAMLKQQGRVVVYFSLGLLLAPVVETLLLLDRMIYLQENGVDSQLVPLFDPNFSPRNFVLVALKPRASGQQN